MKSFSKEFGVLIIMLSICAMGVAQKKILSPGTSDNKRISPVGEMRDEYLVNHMDNPDWGCVRQEFIRKYPEMNVDSLTHFTRAEYYLMTGNEKNRLKELAYLANTYGQTWKPKQLTQFARIVIREDIGLESDALKWTNMALEKEPNALKKKDLNITYAYILAKEGKKREALYLIGEALPIYSPDQLYMNRDGTVGYGLQKKRAICNLFEVEANRAVWLNEKQKRGRYRGNVSFKKDKSYWNKVRDNYLKKEFGSQAADSIMLLGAMYYHESILNDTIGWVAPFVEYSEKYSNKTLREKNDNAWEVFLKSEKEDELRKAIEWSVETIDDKQYGAYTQHTYASLLYKLGKQKEAVLYMQKALSLAKNEKMKTEYQTILAKMENGEIYW